VNHPKEVVQEGDQVQVRIIRIDCQHRRLGLSMRQVAEESYVDVEWREEAEEELEKGEGKQPVAKHEAVLAAFEPQS
jgi:small subunit ribosomal protein S1